LWLPLFWVVVGSELGTLGTSPAILRITIALYCHDDICINRELGTSATSPANLTFTIPLCCHDDICLTDKEFHRLNFIDYTTVQRQRMSRTLPKGDAIDP
jgi:hypothetical protein